MSAHRPYDLAIATLLGPVVIARSAVCATMLIGIGFLSLRVTVANLDPRLAGAAALIVPVALVAWSLWSPASSGFRMWIVETLMVLTLAVSAYAVVVALVKLWTAEFAIGPWLATAWPTLLLLPAMWLVRRGIDLRIGRSADAVAAQGSRPA